MKSKRQKDAEKEANVDIDDIQSELDKAKQREEEKKRKVIENYAKVKESNVYSLMQKIQSVMDVWNLDGILGVFGFGDFLVFVLGLPILYICIAKLHSIRLSVVCSAYLLIDFLVGLVPFVGDFFDFFYKGYRKCFLLIDGYIRRDPDVMSGLNKSFIISLFVLFLYFILFVFYINAIITVCSSFFKLIF